MLYEIRKKHNNSLDGLSIEEIVEESKEFYLESQRIRMFFLVFILFIKLIHLCVNYFNDQWY